MLEFPSRIEFAASSVTTFLDLNNVSALIENGGNMWQNRNFNDAAYEVPKGSGETVIFAGCSHFEEQTIVCN